MLLCVFLLSIHNAVISVFQRKDLGENELYALNEGVRLAFCLFVFYFSVFLTLSLTFTQACWAWAGLYFRKKFDKIIVFYSVISHTQRQLQHATFSLYWHNNTWLVTDFCCCITLYCSFFLLRLSAAYCPLNQKHLQVKRQVEVTEGSLQWV